MAGEVVSQYTKCIVTGAVAWLGHKCVSIHKLYCD